MSIDKMSAALREHITSRLKEVISGGTGEGLTARKLKSFEQYTSRDQIRKDTDTVGGRHESIMSRQAFETLLQDMSKAIGEKELSDKLTTTVQTVNFDGFVAFISEIYYKDKEFLLTDNRRVKNGFVYSGPTRNTTESVAVFAKAEDISESSRDVLLLKNIPQGKLVEYYVEYISNNTPDITPEIKAQLKKSLQGGHLTGVFTARLIRAFNLRKDSTGQVSFRGGGKELTDLEKQLASVVELVTDADFLSSNIALDVDLFTQTDKRLYSNAAEVRLTTEVQFAKSNEEAGRLLTTAGTYLTKLINSVNPTVSNKGQSEAAQVAFKKMLENLQKVSAYVKDRAQQLQQLNKTTKLDPKLERKLNSILTNQETFNTLLTTEGSPSFINHITAVLASALTDQPVQKSSSRAQVKDRARIQGGVTATKPKKSVTKKAPRVRFQEPALKLRAAEDVSLVNLQQLLDQQLQAAVKLNMGDGTARNILNYRTGRFASSVKVERLTQSREGMITAFYTYMKNPYATFSQGGRQELPRSRDPKLLIAQSIRDVARQVVINRLRAVNI
jgi:hypothetical protein